MAPRDTPRARRDGRRPWRGLTCRLPSWCPGSSDTAPARSWRFPHDQWIGRGEVSFDGVDHTAEEGQVHVGLQDVAEEKHDGPPIRQRPEPRAEDTVPSEPADRERAPAGGVGCREAEAQPVFQAERVQRSDLIARHVPDAHLAEYWSAAVEKGLDEPHVVLHRR